jgi:hypothetical protein
VAAPLIGAGGLLYHMAAESNIGMSHDYLESYLNQPPFMLSPSLGITKEIMSRGPQVLDMEYREPY